MNTVLVVDDEKNIADGIGYVLKTELEEDAEIHVCYSSQSAKDFAAAHYIDLIVCDINMPKQNGLSLCRELLENYKALKIIFLTGHSDFSYAYEALKFPDVSYVLKLENESVLLETVRQKLVMLEEENRRKTELLIERQKNHTLNAQLCDLRLERALSGDGNDSYFDAVFLLMRFGAGIDQLRPFLMDTFREQISVAGEDTTWLAAVKAEENFGVTEERAKRLQQKLFDATGIFSTFIFDRPCNEDIRTRYNRLKKICRKTDALYFLDASEHADTVPLGEEDALIARITEYIAAHLGDELSLTVLADMIHYNPAYLSRKFKQVTGENFHAYVLKRRLTLAEHLLKNTELFVQEIAAKCGFQNPTQFGIAFMKHKGCSPSTFRRQ